MHRRPEAEGPSVVPADGSAIFSVSNSWMPASGSVTNPRGSERSLIFERSGHRTEAIYEHSAERGIHTVTVRNGRDPSRQAHLAFAVNLTPEESDLTRLDPDQAHRLLSTSRFTFEDRTAESLQEGPKDTRTEIWRTIILVLFLVILGEILLATVSGSTRASTLIT